MEGVILLPGGDDLVAVRDPEAAAKQSETVAVRAAAHENESRHRQKRFLGLWVGGLLLLLATVWLLLAVF